MIRQDKSLRKISISVENSDDPNKVRGVSTCMVLMTEAYITIRQRSFPAVLFCKDTRKHDSKHMILEKDDSKNPYWD